LSRSWRSRRRRHRNIDFQRSRRGWICWIWVVCSQFLPQFLSISKAEIGLSMQFSSNYNMTIQMATQLQVKIELFYHKCMELLATQLRLERWYLLLQLFEWQVRKWISFPNVTAQLKPW
jgi:hypothetical protein